MRYTPFLGMHLNIAQQIYYPPNSHSKSDSGSAKPLDSEVAKLGAFRCVSIGNEVFEVPESAVKQLQPGIKV